MMLTSGPSRFLAVTDENRPTLLGSAGGTVAELVVAEGVQQAAQFTGPSVTLEPTPAE